MEGEPKKPRRAKAPKQNALVEHDKIENAGLGDALGFTSAAFPFNQGTGWSEQVSNTTTLFKNLRWYFVSNFRQLLNEIYVELGLVQTIVDVPVDDAFRGGIEITCGDLDEEDIRKLVLNLKRDGDILAVQQACKWNRLFGGAGILVMTDQDPETPLDLKSIKVGSPLEFRACDMWELYWDQQNIEGVEPKLVLETNELGDEFYSYYGIKVHSSRVMKLKGLEAPSFVRPRLRGWGFSVVEALVRSMNQYLKATDLGFEVLDEFKLDVYKMKNLVNTLMSPNGKNKVAERVRLANWQKNYQNAIVMDSEDDFDHKQLSFAGLAEAMQGIRLQVASDMRMPITKLFGISAAGFNSGEDDIEVYNAMVESQVRGKIEFDLVRVVEMRCQQLFGFIPEDLEINFKPLRVMSSEQEETVKTQKFARVMQARQLGEINSFEFREACNKDNLLSIQLDVDSIELDGDANLDDAGQDNEKQTDEEPGANKPTSGAAKLPKGKKSSLDAKKAPEAKD